MNELARQVRIDKEERHAFARAILEARAKHLDRSHSRLKSHRKAKKASSFEAIDKTYDQLNGEWWDWLEVARRYDGKVPAQDRLDIRHNIMIELARARARDGKPLPILRAYRIASLTVALYWRQVKRTPTMVSLDSDIATEDGGTVRLIDTVASDKALDLPAVYYDVRTWLLGCPIRLVQIANKKLDGKPLSAKDRMYLSRYRRAEQKKLV